MGAGVGYGVSCCGRPSSLTTNATTAAVTAAVRRAAASRPRYRRDIDGRQAVVCGWAATVVVGTGQVAACSDGVYVGGGGGRRWATAGCRSGGKRAGGCEGCRQWVNRKAVVVGDCCGGG